MRKGYFIVIEGPDGSGSSFHAKCLGERLGKLGMPFLVTEEPSQGIIGATVRSLLKDGGNIAPDALQLLFSSDRAEHVSTMIEPAIAAGTTVICDRYALSTVVYGATQGLKREWLEKINAHFLAPDLQIITLPSFEVSAARIARRAERDFFEQREFQKKVHALYREFAPKDAVIVDTSGEKTAVAEEIYNIVEGRLSLRAIV